MNLSLLIEICINQEDLWLPVIQALRFSWPLHPAYFCPADDSIPPLWDLATTNAYPYPSHTPPHSIPTPGSAWVRFMNALWYVWREGMLETPRCNKPLSYSFYSITPCNFFLCLLPEAFLIAKLWGAGEVAHGGLRVLAALLEDCGSVPSTISHVCNRLLTSLQGIQHFLLPSRDIHTQNKPLKKRLLWGSL